jgi:aminoglycoside phosphotransferase (APT) family kinase protein
MIPIPAYIDPEAWSGFVSMRQAMPKSRPFTQRAAVLILKELQRIKDAGHCPNAALDQSTLRGWADVWPAKEKEITRAPEPESVRVARVNAEREERKRETVPPPDCVRELIKKMTARV